MASESNPILEAVAQVLEPLGDAKEEILGWAKEYLDRCPLVAYCCAKGEPNDADWHDADETHPTPWASPKTYEFEINKPNPLDQSNTVFAMFHWFVQGVVVVYSIKAALLESGDALGVYTRDVVYEPRFTSGPTTLEALRSDLHYHLTATPWDDLEDEPDEPPAGPPAPNGGRRALPGPSSS